MNETGNIALVSETSKNKELAEVSFPIKVDIGLSLGINFGVSGEHSYSWCDATGALYNNTVYTTCVSDVDKNQITSSAGGLDDLFLEAANTVLAEMAKNIITKNGHVSAGVQNDSVKVTGDQDAWLVVLSTVPSDAAVRSVNQEDNYAVLSLLSETDAEDTVTAFSSVGNPYEIIVYTDDSQTTVVTGEELAENPVTLTFHYTSEMLERAGAEEDAEVMLLRYDRENDIYICVAGAVQDRQNMTVTANMAESGEYILAVDLPDTLDNPFTDVSADAYYYDAVLWAVEQDITKGTSANTFSPDNPCTRAQIVTFLYRAAGSPTVTATSKFTDVKAGDYYADAVAWAVANGITQGTTANTFSPDKECTRAEAVTFLYRARSSPVASGTNSFTDVASGAYYANAVQWAVNTGVTAGTSGTTFSPNQTCTRAQIVTFLYRDRKG